MKQVDELDFLLSDLSRRSGFGLPENIACDREGFPFFLGEIFGDDLAACAAEVVDAVSPILTHIDLPVRVCDLVDDLHRMATLLT